MDATSRMDQERTARAGFANESQRYAAADRLARDEFTPRQAAAGFQSQAVQRMENAQLAYEQASTPAQRASPHGIACCPGRQGA